MGCGESDKAGIADVDLDVLTVHRVERSGAVVTVALEGCAFVGLVLGVVEDIAEGFVAADTRNAFHT